MSNHVSLRSGVPTYFVNFVSQVTISIHHVCIETIFLSFRLFKHILHYVKVYLTSYLPVFNIINVLYIVIQSVQMLILSICSCFCEIPFPYKYSINCYIFLLSFDFSKETIFCAAFQQSKKVLRCL